MIRVRLFHNDQQCFSKVSDLNRNTLLSAYKYHFGVETDDNCFYEVLPLKKAFGTMVSTIDYLPGAKLLYDSLIQNKTQYEFVLFVPNTFSEEMVRSYGFETNNIFFFESVLSENITDRQQYTLDKIHVLNIPDGLRICLLDADIQVLRNIDHYLDFLHGSAYINSPYNQDGMNGGVLIFERNEEEYKKALEIVKNCQNDEEVWLKLYPNFHLEYIKHLPVGDWRDNPDQMRVFHDDGFPKSWMI